MGILRFIFSNVYFFPLLQAALLALLLFAIRQDRRARRAARRGMSATPSPTFGVTGSDAALVKTFSQTSLSALANITGLVIGAIITVINKSVFDDNEACWKHYSAAFNSFDYFAIIYICYSSECGREYISERIERLKKVRR
jgi:hypothetical protein